ncbi:hypothetical protein F0L74_22290 [Chitinophaga agrisoli]|uniref:Uncharacterized protein n=1 Tax=Chitinophaga agrisoli TaxID=2607653 RepID=A0A5B2VL16_9BACT|nr:hypothetical protein [Chitinophaga agrisoli]KAA2238947.1 hypothetical protein F0L74_22290 [Chitinophaga agrisoli]
MNLSKRLLSAGGLLSLAVTLSFQSCAPSGGGSSRKKMPELTGSQSLESYVPYGMQQGNAAFPFATGYVDVMANGQMETLLSVALPDAAEDSMMLSIIAHYKPLATMLLTQWAQQQKTGVLIDLRSSPVTTALRADFMVQRQDAFSLPVVFLWDRNSAPRAAGYMRLLDSAPGFNITRQSASLDNSFEGQNGFGNF